MRALAVMAAVFMLAMAPLADADAANVSKQEIAKILTDQGYNVRDFDSNKLSVSVGDYIIIVGVDGMDGDITYLTYLSGVGSDQVGYQLLNDFNNEVKFARAYIDGDGDVAIQMDRNSSGGVSAENIQSDFDIFLKLVWKFLNDLEMQRIA